MSVRGNIDSQQIKPADRQGNGTLIQMYTGSAPVSGHGAGFDANGNLVDSGIPASGAVTSVFGRTGAVVAASGDYNEFYMTWVPYTYTSPPQSFSKQDLTRDGDWTMVANKDTSTRPAPQPSGAEEDLLPAWTPTMSSARATYTVLNEWTLNQSGWIDQYGVDVLTQNVGASHVITLQVNGVVKDTFTAIPNAAQLYWHDITPLVVVSGAVIRVTLQVTEVGNNLMYWEQQTALFATPPTYCSLAQGAKDAGAMGSTAYGCHLLFIPGTASPDWDVVAYGGTAAGGAAVVSSVFGRIGAVVAVTGDYTAAQVTNAVSTIGSYADPAWLTSLAWSKITGAPTVSGAANYVPIFTAANSLGNSVIYQSGSNIGISTASPSNALDIGTGGGIHITSGIPASTAMALYNNAGALNWNGTPLVTNAAISGTTQFIPVFTSPNSLGNSILTQPGSFIQLNGATLGTSAGAVVTDLSIYNSVNNASYLNFSVRRFAAGTDWTTASARIQLTIDASLMGYIDFNPSGVQGGIAFGSQGSGSQVQAMLITSGGNCGISTTSPNRLLEVGAGILSTMPASIIRAAVLGALAAADTNNRAIVIDMSNTVFSGASEIYAYNYTSSAFIPLHINASQIIMGDSSRGNAEVGIGPAGIASGLRLTVSETTPFVARFQGSYGSSISNDTFIVYHGSAAATDLWYVGTDIAANNGSQDFHFGNNGGSASGVTMTLQRGGNVGIGSISPTSPLTVFGTSPQILIGDGSGDNYSVGRDSSTGFLDIKGTQVNYTGYAFFVNASTQVLTITNSGNLGVGLSPSHQLQLSTDDAAKTATTTWTVASDARLKRNIRDLTGGLSIIGKLHLIEAEYNGLAGTPEGLRVTGFLAHELRAIVPHAVGSTRGKLRDSDAEETDILDMNLHEVLMHLILAVQQLNQRTEKN
jgi:hypothetical protein